MTGRACRHIEIFYLRGLRNSIESYEQHWLIYTHTNQMLTYQQFRALSEAEKSNYVWHQAVFLASYRADSTYCTGLFHSRSTSRSDYFIEVWYNLEKDCVESWKTFRTHRLLEPYLDLINLEVLMA